MVDSGSTDGTCDIVAEVHNVRIARRVFDNHASQWNYAISETGITSEWVLALDADYGVTDELLQEIDLLNPPNDVDGYEVGFTYCVFGKRLRGSLYPPVTVLFRRSHGRFVQDGHTQRLLLAGGVRRLTRCMLHDDRKSLRQWLIAQDSYMGLEVEKLLTSGSPHSAADRVRQLIVVAPFLAFLYALFVKGTVLDGRAGIYYAFQRMTAEAILSLRLLERRLNSKSDT